jgi:UDP-N-acetylmuramoyl-L-alanyl-D-glutamate--2,6-diaminopimelate ligase
MPEIEQWRSLRIRRLVTDSRQVRAGDTFMAYPGETTDGRRYIGEAVRRGAASVLWDSGDFRWNPRWRVPNAGIPLLRQHAGDIAAEHFGFPAASMWTVGVTGTNGKTSCSHWIAQALSRARRKCGLIGTLGNGFAGKLKPQLNTTPDAVTLQGSLAGMRRARARAVCMEVSSIGLSQDRLAGMRFDVALLTNLTRDHLDFHGSMRHYRVAKARLFDWPALKYAVINADDSFGVELLQRPLKGGAEKIAYGFGRSRARSSLPRVAGSRLRLGLDGLSFDVRSPWGQASVHSPLLGAFNAANLLGVLSVLLVSGVALDRAVRLLGTVMPVAGRMTRVGGGGLPLVVVDYAHTPDALRNALETLREVLPSRARLTVVFGCGGNRDRGKRRLMGRVAAELADNVIVTSDNPRDEEPAAIARDIVAGMRGDVCDTILDRRAAIREALSRAAPGDIVLVAGKGHENYQEVQGQRRRFSDLEVARALLAKLSSTRPVREAA